MASPNASIAATTHANFVKGDIVDAVTNATPLFNALKKEGKIKYGEGGTSYRPPPIRYRQHTIEGWDGRNIITAYEPDFYTNAEHPWCGYLNTWVDNEWDSLENQAGPERIADMYADVAESLKVDWVVFLEGKIFADGSTSLPAGILGLPAFMKTTGSYGGIAQSETYWQPYVLDGVTGATPRTFKTDPWFYMTKLFNEVANRQRTPGPSITNYPDFVMTTKDIFEHLLSVAREKGMQNVTVTTETGGTNIQALVFMGAKIYWSSYCPSGKLYALRLNKMELVFQTRKMFGTRSVEVLQPIGMAHQSWTKLQLVVNDIRGLGLITGISVA